MAVPSKREAVASKLIESLKKERERQKMSMTTLAEKSGLSVTMISFVERGLRKPTLDTLQRMAEALGVQLGKALTKAEKLNAS